MAYEPVLAVVVLNHQFFIPLINRLISKKSVVIKPATKSLFIIQVPKVKKVINHNNTKKRNIPMLFKVTIIGFVYFSVMKTSNLIF